LFIAGTTIKRSTPLIDERRKGGREEVDLITLLAKNLERLQEDVLAKGAGQCRENIPWIPEER